MPFKIAHSVKDLDEIEWNLELKKENAFLKSDFLEIYEKSYSSKDIIPFYISFDNGLIYGHLIKIQGAKIANYFKVGRFSIKKLFLKTINFQFFCFGNSHFSNISSNYFEKEKINEIDFKLLLKHLKEIYKTNFFLLPDHFLTSLKDGKYEEMSPVFEIDPDMVLNIDIQWNSFQDYCDSIQSKYKKRVRKVLKDSSSLAVKKLNINEIEELMPKLQTLYNNVHQKSSFSGPPLDINSYLNFAKYSEIEFSLYGYFNNDEIVAFSSEFCNEKNLYSYFIGLNYAQNKKYSLYNRILYDSIKHGIDKKATKIIYGRTAAEFKSTIGAVPIKSKSAIYISNKILRLLFYPIAKKLSPKSWLQRNPFKGKANE